MMKSRVVGIAGMVRSSVGWLFGSVVFYAAHLACGGGGSTIVPKSAADPASTAPSTIATSAPPSAAASTLATTTTASLAVTGSDAITLDPVDAESSLEVAFVRGPDGKRRVALTALVRAYRLDAPSDRRTTIAIRAWIPDTDAIATGEKIATAATPATVTDAYVTTWSAPGAVAPHVYATSSGPTFTVTMKSDGDVATIALAGSIALRDVASGRAINVDHVAIEKRGIGLFSRRLGALRAP